MGRQLGRPTSVSVHLTATLNDLKPSNHKGKPFTWETQGDNTNWKSKSDYIINNAKVFVDQVDSSKKIITIGKDHDNVISNMTYDVKSTSNA